MAAITGTDSGVEIVASSAFQALDAGVAAPGALLGIAISRPHGVVDVDERDLIGAGQDRGRTGQPGEEPGGHGVELADVTEAQQPQKRAQR